MRDRSGQACRQRTPGGPSPPRSEAGSGSAADLLSIAGRCASWSSTRSGRGFTLTVARALRDELRARGRATAAPLAGRRRGHARRGRRARGRDLGHRADRGRRRPGARARTGVAALPALEGRPAAVFCTCDVAPARDARRSPTWLDRPRRRGVGRRACSSGRRASRRSARRRGRASLAAFVDAPTRDSVARRRVRCEDDAHDHEPAAVLTVSDGVTHGTRADESGDVAAGAPARTPASTSRRARSCADERRRIEAALRRLAAAHALVVTTGGHGVRTARRHAGGDARGARSRGARPGRADARGRARAHADGVALPGDAPARSATRVVVNLPGSPKGVRESLDGDPAGRCRTRSGCSPGRPARIRPATRPRVAGPPASPGRRVEVQAVKVVAGAPPCRVGMLDVDRARRADPRHARVRRVRRSRPSRPPPRSGASGEPATAGAAPRRRRHRGLPRAAPRARRA